MRFYFFYQNKFLFEMTNLFLLHMNCFVKFFGGMIGIRLSICKYSNFYITSFFFLVLIKKLLLRSFDISSVHFSTALHLSHLDKKPNIYFLCRQGRQSYLLLHKALIALSFSLRLKYKIREE